LSREWGWGTVGNKTGEGRVLITNGHIDLDLTKMFLILSIASSLSKDKVEKEGSVSLSGLEKAMFGVTPERVGIEMEPGLVYLFI